MLVPVGHPQRIRLKELDQEAASTRPNSCKLSEFHTFLNDTHQMAQAIELSIIILFKVALAQILASARFTLCDFHKTT